MERDDRQELDPDALDRWITGDYGERYRALPVPDTHNCPECGSSEIGDRDARAREYAGEDEKPPFRMACDDCGFEWAEDELGHRVDEE